MIKYLVIGDPVAHSRSPKMQNAAFESCGMGSPYGIRHVKPEELPEFFEYARTHLAGVNLTVPHKLRAAELADTLTLRAKQCKSVNTLIIKEGLITGDSTDGVGLERALMHNFGLPVKGKSFLFAGAGGAARATAIHFACAGAKRIMFLNRTASKAFEIIEDIDNLQTGCFCGFIDSKEREFLAAELKNTDCIIQATSLGLKEDDPAPFDLSLLEADMQLVIFDTIYKNTKLLQKAAELGIPCAGGKEMLIQQGAESFRLWTGMEPDLDAMRAGFELPPGGVEA